MDWNQLLTFAFDPTKHPRGGHISNKGKFSKYIKIGDTVSRLTAPKADPTFLNNVRQMFKQQEKSIIQYLTLRDKLPLSIPSFDFVSINFIGKFKKVLEKHALDAAHQTLATLGVDDQKHFVSAKDRVSASVESGLNTALTSIHKTTEKHIQEAITLFHNNVKNGTIKGDNKKELIKRVKAVFKEALEDRSELIAEIETSRAIHSGEDIGAKLSLKVNYKRWRCNVTACDGCKVEAAKGWIMVNKPFTKTSYGEVYYPPLHPNCRCFLEYKA